MGLISRLFNKNMFQLDEINFKGINEEIVERNSNICKRNLGIIANNLPCLFENSNFGFMIVEQEIAKINKDERVLKEYVGKPDFSSSFTVACYYSKMYSIFYKTAKDENKKTMILNSLKFLIDYVAYNTTKYYKKEENLNLVWNPKNKEFKNIIVENDKVLCLVESLLKEMKQLYKCIKTEKVTAVEQECFDIKNLIEKAVFYTK